MVSDAVPKNRQVAGMKQVADQRNYGTPQMHARRDSKNREGIRPQLSSTCSRRVGICCENYVTGSADEHA